jgi:hypothetical protein
MFLGRCLGAYALETLDGCSLRQWSDSFCALLARVGLKMLLCKDWTTGIRVDLAVAEQKLRDKLRPDGAGLPSPVSLQAPAPALAAAKQGFAQSRADAAPPATFVDGKLVLNHTALARSRGVLPGKTVKCLRALDGVKVGEWGRVTQVDDIAVWVAWFRAPGVESSDDQALPCADVTALAVGTPPAAPAQPTVTKEEAMLANAMALMQLPNGVAWTSLPARDVPQALVSMVSGALWQVAVAHAVSPAELRLCEEKKKEAVFAVTKPFKPYALRLLPWPTEISLEPPDEDSRECAIPAFVKFCEDADVEEVSLWLSPPMPGGGGRPRKDEVESDSGPLRVVYPFWDIMTAARPRDARRLHRTIEKLSIPLGTLQGEGALKMTRGGGKRMLVCSIPFLTNEEELAIGDRVWSGWSEKGALADADATT